MEALIFGPIKLPGASALPNYLMPIARAAGLGANLIPEITSLVDTFGFTSFTYWAATRSTPIVEGRIYELSTLPTEWAPLYDEKGYVEVDPRIGATRNQTTPLAWDRSTWSGRTRETDEFLNDAAAFGIGSGVCIPIHDASFGVARFDFDSQLGRVSIDRQGAIRHAFADLLLAARFLHDLFVTAIRRNELRPRSSGLPLSHREQECLLLATRGLTANELANALRIDLHIVHAHFDSIRAKLGCWNRDEAIAFALKNGLGNPYIGCD